MADMMRKIVRGVSSVVTVGGMMLVGRSLRPIPAFDKEMREKETIVLEAREKYGVNLECASVGFGVAACTNRVRGRHTQAEEAEIFQRFNDEVMRRQALVPVDPEAHKQAERDGLGLFIGMPATTLGLIGIGLTGKEEKRKGKQFRNSIERRKGRGKEGM